MRRRDLIAGVAATAVVRPRPVSAQQKAMPVIGFLNPGPPVPGGPFTAAFRAGLSDAGYIEGKNVAIEYRGADNRYDRLPALAADLVGRKVDVIVTNGPYGGQAAKGATSTIPIVFNGVGDPVGAGLVTNLARPDANLTGFSIQTVELLPKLVELLHELAPQVRVMALLVNPTNPNTPRNIDDAQTAARAKGVQLAILKASTENAIDAAFATLVGHHAGALIVAADGLFSARREQLVALASRRKVPAIYVFREFADAGGLISYGASIADSFRQSGVYAGRILKGEKPADLPVQQPTKFELVINLNTAKALGLTVPQTLLARADEVIE
jgi:putative ABC transport system substrate-binding protein